MTHACAELVSRCFAARTSAHMAHLTTTSYAQHVALGDFYDAIASGADEFVECYMGIFGKLSSFPSVRLAAGDQIQALTDLREWIADNREDCCEAPYDENDEADELSDEVEHTELANLIDNILAVVDRTIYKLKFLK